MDGGGDRNAIHFLFDMHHRVEHLAVAVQVANEGGDAAFKIEGHLAARSAHPAKDGHAAGDKGHFAQALDQGVKAKVQVALEDFRVKFEGGLGAGGVVVGLADHLDRAGRIAALVALASELSHRAGPQPRTTLKGH